MPMLYTIRTCTPRSSRNPVSHDRGYQNAPKGSAVRRKPMNHRRRILRLTGLDIDESSKR